MAYMNITTGASLRQSWLGTVAERVANLASGLLESWRQARVYRVTYEELDRLSTRELEDLGLSRSMISRVAFDAAYGRAE
jgi:uncharacterized protein YjiS (DUF1127 family)